MKNGFNDKFIVLVSAFSIFLPYVITFAVIAFFSIYVLATKRTRKMIFHYKEAWLLLPFSLIAIIAPICYGNYIGLVGGVGMILLLLFGLFVRRVMTKELFERVLTNICSMSVIICIIAIIERAIGSLVLHNFMYQCKATFFNPNYFGTITSMVIVICAYKVITRQGEKRTYYTIAAINAISMFLCGSLFVWVEMFVGIATLLILSKRHKMLLTFIGAAVFGCFLLFFFPQIIPRVGDADSTFELRMRVWRVVIEGIKASPFFGRGLLTYYHIYEDYMGAFNVWPTEHAHNLCLDPILNFGFIGATILVTYFVKYYIDLLRNHRKNLDLSVSSLIFAVSAGALAHGTTDITVLWIQSGLLFIIILSGIGALEKKGKNKINDRN